MNNIFISRFHVIFFFSLYFSLDCCWVLLVDFEQSTVFSFIILMLHIQDLCAHDLMPFCTLKIEQEAQKNKNWKIYTTTDKQRTKRKHCQEQVTTPNKNVVHSRFIAKWKANIHIKNDNGQFYDNRLRCAEEYFKSVAVGLFFYSGGRIRACVRNSDE